MLEVPARIADNSPCNGICTLDERTGWCLGCGRTGEEIGRWPTASAAERNAVGAQLPARLKSIGSRPF